MSASTTQHAVTEQEDQIKEDEGRDPAYFQYYSQLIHQQNMLSDYVRTQLYQQVVYQNSEVNSLSLSDD
jgi:hypothetical protein